MINPNARQTLSVYPTIKEIGYADPINSEMLNEQFTSLQESVLRTLIRTQEINDSLTTFEAAVGAQATALGSYYSVLNYTQEAGKAFLTSFDTQINSGTDGIKVDALYGYTTLKTIANYSKIPRLEGYDGKVSPDVKIYINGEEQAQNSSAYRALDNSTKTLWFDQFDPESEVVMEIVLPPSLTKRFNYIQLDPFPVFGFDITKITYQDLYGHYHEVDEFFFGPHAPLQNNRALPTKIFCAPKEFNGTIKIYGKTLANGFFGFSNIDIGFMDFNDTTHEGYAEFLEFRNNSASPKTYSLKSALIDFYFDSATANSLISAKDVMTAQIIASTVIDGVLQGSTKYKVIDLSTNREHNLNNFQITVDPGQSLYFKFSMKENNLTTPVLRGVKLEYVRN